jgi:hypothetical protein
MRQLEDVGVHLLQQQDEARNQRAGGQARASEIVDELREVTPAVMQVPRDERDKRTVRDNDGDNADRGARASEGQRGDENSANQARALPLAIAAGPSPGWPSVFLGALRAPSFVMRSGCGDEILVGSRIRD